MNPIAQYDVYCSGCRRFRDSCQCNATNMNIQLMNQPIQFRRLNADNRGEIFAVAERADIIKVTSVKGARRANHYHKEHGHWCLVTAGSLHYYERPVGSQQKPSYKVFNVGNMFWTGPMIEHVMLFPTYDQNEFYCFSVGARDPESYEKDTVRMDFELDKQ